MSIINSSYKQEFFTAYIEAALWLSEDDSGTPLDENYSEESFSRESLKAAYASCLLFISENHHLLQQCNYNNPEYSNASLAGHDFWLTRNGHGAGFWDRGLGGLGDKLSDSCKSMGECWLYVGEDGLLYLG